MPRKPKTTAEEVDPVETESNNTSEHTDTGSSEPEATSRDSGEKVATYFRKIFKRNPKLLHERKNAPLFRRWLRDHPGHTEVPQSVKVGLQNIKSVLRKEEKNKPGRRPSAPQEEESRPVALPRIRRGDLERLEFLIDECLGTARRLEPEALSSVIEHLREARNEVVLRMGPE